MTGRRSRPAARRRSATRRRSPRRAPSAYDLSDFVNPAHPLPPGCDIRIVGVAPGASIVALKAGGELLPNSAILQAIDYAVTVAHVDVINESFGANIYPDSTAALDTIELFNDAAVARRRDGDRVHRRRRDHQHHRHSVDRPERDLGGASTDSRLYAQTGVRRVPVLQRHLGERQHLGAVVRRASPRAAAPPDLVAPGRGRLGGLRRPPAIPCVQLPGRPQPTDIQSFGGTSESAPLTAGAAALVIQAYRDAPRRGLPDAGAGQAAPHQHRPGPRPAGRRAGLRPAGRPRRRRGRLGDAARTSPRIPTRSSSRPSRATQQNVSVQVDEPGQQRPRRSARTSRSFVPPRTTRRRRCRSTTRPTRLSPTTTAPVGLPQGDVRRAGRRRPARRRDRLAGRPDGQRRRREPDRPDDAARAATGRSWPTPGPQGGPASANYGFVDVRSPAAGAWTAVLYTPSPSADGPGAAGYTGPVLLDASFGKAVARPRPQTPSVTLAPGATRPSPRTCGRPPSGGDATEALVLDNGAGQTTGVPVVLRPVIKVQAARDVQRAPHRRQRPSFSPAQTFTYEFDVPSATRTMTSECTSRARRTPSSQGVLIQPNGEASASSGTSTSTRPVTATSTSDLRLVQPNPEPGRWRFVLSSRTR